MGTIYEGPLQDVYDVIVSRGDLYYNQGTDQFCFRCYRPFFEHHVTVSEEKIGYKAVSVVYRGLCTEPQFKKLTETEQELVKWIKQIENRLDKLDKKK